MTTKTKLPEKWRKARNIDKGYEIRSQCHVHNTDEWLRVTHQLHVLAPLAVVSFTVEPVDGPADCLAQHDNRLSAHPNDDIFSRRPADV